MGGKEEDAPTVVICRVATSRLEPTHLRTLMTAQAPLPKADDQVPCDRVVAIFA
jgi:hypothetical protein